MFIVPTSNGWTDESRLWTPDLPFEPPKHRYGLVRAHTYIHTQHVTSERKDGSTDVPTPSPRVRHSRLHGDTTCLRGR